MVICAYLCIMPKSRRRRQRGGFDWTFGFGTKPTEVTTPGVPKPTKVVAQGNTTNP